MKKLSVSLVLALTVVTGLAGVAASAPADVLATPCCKAYGV